LSGLVRMPCLAQTRRHRQDRLEALLGVAVDPNRGYLLPPFVEGPLDLLGQNPRLLGVELDPGDAEAAAAELDAAGTRQAELDPGLLQAQQVLRLRRQL